MSKSKNVINWRRRTKERMVAAFDKKCCICGKTYPQECFEFHHLDPSEKSFGLGTIRSNCISWEKIVTELRKCVMVCANCHRLVEYGYVQMPSDPYRFNEKYTDYKKNFPNQQLKTDNCRCGRKKPVSQKYCSRDCYNIYRRHTNWPTKYELRDLLKEHSLKKIGQLYGVSASAVNKWKKYYGLGGRKK
jgi:hypothetical protein